jgi:hypothetical protein
MRVHHRACVRTAACAAMPNCQQRAARTSQQRSAASKKHRTTLKHVIVRRFQREIRATSIQRPGMNDTVEPCPASSHAGTVSTCFTHSCNTSMNQIRHVHCVPGTYLGCLKALYVCLSLQHGYTTPCQAGMQIYTTANNQSFKWHALCAAPQSCISQKPPWYLH